MDVKKSPQLTDVTLCNSTGQRVVDQGFAQALLDPALATDRTVPPLLRATVRRHYGMVGERGIIAHVPRGLREQRDAIAAAVWAAKRYRLSLDRTVALARFELHKVDAIDIGALCNVLEALTLAGRKGEVKNDGEDGGDDPIYLEDGVVVLGVRSRKKFEDGEIKIYPAAWQPRDVAHEVIAWARGDRHGGDSWERKIRKSHPTFVASKLTPDNDPDGQLDATVPPPSAPFPDHSGMGPIPSPSGPSPP